MRNQIKSYMIPKYSKGDIVNINTDSESLPGCKQLKKGKYEIISYRPSLTSKTVMIYTFKSIRKGSTYEYAFSKEWVENNSNLIK
jgi:hypothetical protein